MIGLQQGRGPADDGLRLRVGRHCALADVDDHLHPGGVQAGELLAQNRAGLNRWAAAVLPARSGQLLLHLRCEGIQHPHDDELADNHDAQMGSGPAAQSGDPAGFVGLRDRPLQAGGCADHDDSSTARAVEADR